MNNPLFALLLEAIEFQICCVKGNFIPRDEEHKIPMNFWLKRAEETIKNENGSLKKVENFWSLFEEIMTEKELKKFPIFVCDQKHVFNFDIFKNSWKELMNDLWERAFSVLLHFSALEFQKFNCQSRTSLTKNDQAFCFEVQNSIYKKQNIIGVSIFTKSNLAYVPANKNINLFKDQKKLNNTLFELWNQKKYDEIIEKINSNKEIFLKNFFKLEGKDGIKKFFKNLLEQKNSDPQKLLYSETHNILNSLNKLRNKIFKEAVFKSKEKKAQSEVECWENFSKKEKKIYTKLILDVYSLTQNFYFLINENENV